MLGVVHRQASDYTPRHIPQWTHHLCTSASMCFLSAQCPNIKLCPNVMTARTLGPNKCENFLVQI